MESETTIDNITTLVKTMERIAIALEKLASCVGKDGYFWIDIAK